MHVGLQTPFWDTSVLGTAVLGNGRFGTWLQLDGRFGNGCPKTAVLWKRLRFGTRPFWDTAVLGHGLFENGRFGTRPFWERPFWERPFWDTAVLGHGRFGNGRFGNGRFGTRPFWERPFWERPFWDDTNQYNPRSCGNTSAIIRVGTV